MKHNLRRFALFFAAQFLSYFLATVSYRACAQANYLVTGITDGFLAANSFLVVKRIAESKSYWELAGYITGGIAGSQVAILVSTMWILHG